MITLIGTIIGLLSGLLPEVLKYMTARANNAEQLAMTELQLKYAQQNLSIQAAADTAKIQLVGFQSVVDASLRPTKYAMIDFWNSLIRPVTISFMLLLFMGSASLYAGYLVLQVWGGEISEATAAGILWDSPMIGGAMQASLGFVFGYRSAITGLR